MLADIGMFFAEYLFSVLFDQGPQLFRVLLLLCLHFLPKRYRIRMPLGIFDVISLDTPETFVLLNVLLHQIIDMIVLHDVCVMANG